MWPDVPEKPKFSPAGLAVLKRKIKGGTYPLLHAKQHREQLLLVLYNTPSKSYPSIVQQSVELGHIQRLVRIGEVNRFVAAAAKVWLLSPVYKWAPQRVRTKWIGNWAVRRTACGYGMPSPCWSLHPLFCNRPTSMFDTYLHKTRHALRFPTAVVRGATTKGRYAATTLLCEHYRMYQVPCIFARGVASVCCALRACLC